MLCGNDGGGGDGVGGEASPSVLDWILMCSKATQEVTQVILLLLPPPPPLPSSYPLTKQVSFQFFQK